MKWPIIEFFGVFLGKTFLVVLHTALTTLEIEVVLIILVIGRMHVGLEDLRTLYGSPVLGERADGVEDILENAAKLVLFFDHDLFLELDLVVRAILLMNFLD